ncbi:DUF4190 domain-containing protein [Streptomyces sp. NPDC017086]|uniref:DUF4190 domain-containing protein n=1 Tax=Streptomyces sp. NPDC017086 TaxID=3364976 RepID=UPI0037B65D61
MPAAAVPERRPAESAPVDAVAVTRPVDAVPAPVDAVSEARPVESVPAGTPPAAGAGPGASSGPVAWAGPAGGTESPTAAAPQPSPFAPPANPYTPPADPFAPPVNPFAPPSATAAAPQPQSYPFAPPASAPPVNPFAPPVSYAGAEPVPPPPIAPDGPGQVAYGYPGPPHAGYGAVPYPVADGYGWPGMQAPNNGMGTAALVLGIISALGFFMWPVALVLGVLALVFGGIGRGRSRRGEATNPGVALAGIICGATGIVLALGMVAFVIALYA